MKNDRIIRAYTAEMRAQIGEENEHIIDGYASVYEDEADIYGYYKEIVARGAFDGCKLIDVIFCINHDTGKIPLARARNNYSDSTLKLKIDEKGLYIEARLDTERNADAAALYSAVERGDMGGMSFIFKVEDEKWDDLDGDFPTRTITKIAEVYEVTAATFPFYGATTLDTRANSSLEHENNVLENARTKIKKEKEPEERALQVERMKKLYKTRAKLGI